MGSRARHARTFLCAADPERDLNLPVEAMGPRWVWTRGRLFEQGRLFQRDRRSTGLIARFSESGKMMRERGSFGSWEEAHLNGNNTKPCQYRKLCNFKKMLSQ